MAAGARPCDWSMPAGITHTPVMRTARRSVLLAASGLLPRVRARANEPAPVLVELFTSQGCSSCPPADALLAELAQDPDVLPLAFHVTYWDRLGWTDGFADLRFDQRQRAYANVLGVPRIYTPQAVVAGELDVVGSSRARMLAAIAVARTHGEARPLHIEANGRVAVPTDLERAGTELWAAAWDGPRTVTIERGEKIGRAHV